MDTKETILHEAIELAADRGFESVSIRDIARASGIRESSIYNHYAGKEAILEAILTKFISYFDEMNPELDEDAALDEMGLDEFFSAGMSSLLAGVGDEQHYMKLWRVIAIELHRNERVKEFYKTTLREAPMAFWEGIFLKMMDKGMIPRCDAHELAEEFFSYALLMFFEAFLVYYEEDPTFFSRMAGDRIARHARFIVGKLHEKEAKE
ncbi:MAG TPA: TetR/AcrR family transcriptional regulator [Methanomicrobia archaeon]|nr:TetR/AcrR family transcriptional regulator [Methanomicrobia archaeon]